MFRIILFKIFNTEPTWQALEKEFKKKNLGERLLEARNFRKAFEVMNSVGGFGKFISYHNFHKLGNKRRMQPIDCQNVFCETDKYCREAHPELKSACAQIKNTYTKSKPSINFIYPPKWGLDFTNDKK